MTTSSRPVALVTGAGRGIGSAAARELAGAFFITQRVLEVMRRQERGQIIYISSTAADFVGTGRLSQSTAKSALNTSVLGRVVEPHDVAAVVGMLPQRGGRGGEES